MLTAAFKVVIRGGREWILLARPDVQRQGQTCMHAPEVGIPAISHTISKLKLDEAALMPQTCRFVSRSAFAWLLHKDLHALLERSTASNRKIL